MQGHLNRPKLVEKLRKKCLPSLSSATEYPAFGTLTGEVVFESRGVDTQVRHFQGDKIPQYSNEFWVQLSVLH